jgi:hypothetical protein
LKRVKQAEVRGFVRALEADDGEHAGELGRIVVREESFDDGVHIEFMYPEEFDGQDEKQK